MFLTIVSESPTFGCMVRLQSLVIATFIGNGIMSPALILYSTTMVNTVRVVSLHEPL